MANFDKGVNKYLNPNSFFLNRARDKGVGMGNRPE